MTTTDDIDTALIETQPELPKINTGSLTAEQIAEYDREGYLILPNLLTPEDLVPVKQALCDKVSAIADQLFADGLIKDKRESDPFETRLVNLFKDLDEATFLKFGRSWRDPVAGYFHLISNPRFSMRSSRSSAARFLRTRFTMLDPRSPASRPARSRGTRTNRTGRTRTGIRSSRSGFPSSTRTSKTAASTSGPARTRPSSSVTTPNRTPGPATPRLTSRNRPIATRFVSR